jgi:hypothetical protein
MLPAMSIELPWSGVNRFQKDGLGTVAFDESRKSWSVVIVTIGAWFN